jgi:dCMP deaminase
MKLSKKYKRKSWDRYFKEITEVVASRANCRTRQTGAVLVKNKMIISTGYNGTPKGVKNCYEGGCPRCNDETRYNSGKDLDRCICVHAEENAVIQAAFHGMPTQGATVYTIYCPCTWCSKVLINAGIKEVVYWDDYAKLDFLSNDMFRQAGVKVRKIK